MWQLRRFVIFLASRGRPPRYYRCMLDEFEAFSIYARRTKGRLTRLRQLELAQLIAAGNRKALHELVEPYLLLALEHALSHIEPKNVPRSHVMPYVHASVEGLYRAAATWSKKGASIRHDFGGYAGWWMSHYLAKHEFKTTVQP